MRLTQLAFCLAKNKHDPHDQGKIHIILGRTIKFSRSASKYIINPTSFMRKILQMAQPRLKPEREREGSPCTKTIQGKEPNLLPSQLETAKYLKSL